MEKSAKRMQYALKHVVGYNFLIDGLPGVTKAKIEPNGALGTRTCAIRMGLRRKAIRSSNLNINN